MRSQECRKHIQKTGKVCKLSTKTMDAVQKVLEFVEDHPQISDLSTDAAKALMDIPDPIIQQKAISHIENALTRKTPRGGSYKKRLTKPEVEKVIKTVSPPENVKKELYVAKPPVSKKEPISLHPNIKKQNPSKCFSYQPGTIPVTDAPQIESLGEKVRKQEMVEAEKNQPTPVEEPEPVVVPPPRPPTPAPCTLLKQCPDLQSHVILEKVRGRVCDVLNIPINQLPGPDKECPLEKKERLKNTPVAAFVRASTTMDNLDAAKPIKPAPYVVKKALLTDGERDTATDALIERTRFTRKDVEQIDELVKVNREGWACRFDLIEAAVMMLLAKAEGA